MPKHALAAASLATLCALAPCGASATDAVVTVPTREGVTDKYILVTSDDAPKKVVVITFIGAPGVMHLERRPQPLVFGKGTNALVRIRNDLVNADIADVIVDSPSDQLRDGMSDYFRASDEHAADIRAVIADVRKRYPDARIFLMGTSRGTVSAANLGVALGSEIAGVILSSTITVATRGGGPGLSAFDFDKIKVPLLFVHHQDDACNVSPYYGIKSLAAKYPVVVASGGLPPESGPCEPLAAHGFYGLDAPLVAVLQAFMTGKPYPRTIP
jgi:dienelactone hydrolase